MFWQASQQCDGPSGCKSLIPSSDLFRPCARRRGINALSLIRILVAMQSNGNAPGQR